MKEKFVGLFALATALFAATWAEADITQTKWTGLDPDAPTDLATAGNWDPQSVPELDTTLAQPNGPFASFTNMDAKVSLTMSRDLYLNGLVFGGNTSTHDIDLTGRTLKLYGYTNDGTMYLMRVNDGVWDTISFKNGTFDTSGHYVTPSGFDAHPYLHGYCPVSFSGTHFPSMTYFDVCNRTYLYLTNGVTGKIRASMAGNGSTTSIRTPKIVIAGEGTVIDQEYQSIDISADSTKFGGELFVQDGAVLTNSNIQVGFAAHNASCRIANATVWATPKDGKWIGAGINPACSNNVLAITDGAKVHLNGYTYKTQMYCGRFGCSNLVVVSGANTLVDCDVERGADTLTVGEAGYDNFAHITDHATYTRIGQKRGDFTIGPIEGGYTRGDARRNAILVDGGASVDVDRMLIAGWCTRDASRATSVRRTADGTITYCGSVTKSLDTDYCYTVMSNRLTVSGAGTTFAVGENGYVAGTANTLYHDYPVDNVFRVESNATASFGLLLYVGKRGYRNGVEVDAGSSLSVGKYNLEIGDPANSTGAYVRVSSGSTVSVLRTAASNGYLKLLGSGAGGEALFEVTGGSAASANAIATTGARNAIRLENGTLTSTQAVTYPSDDTTAGAIRFEIAGTNSQMSVTGEKYVNGNLTFGEGVAFDFDLPAEGYVRAPFLAAKAIAFTGVPTVRFTGHGDLSSSSAKVTLFEAGTTLTASDAVVAAFDAAARAVCPNGQVKLVDGKKIVLHVRRGVCVIVK